VVRRSCLVALVLALAAGLASGARADADPASDWLYVRDVFLPFEGVSKAVGEELTAAARTAKDDGTPIKIAVIASRRDLGGVPSLFGKPLYYARFLGAELEFLYSGKLLVVMPQGAALSQRGRLIANPMVLRAEIEPGTDGLVRTATRLVRELSGQGGSSGQEDRSGDGGLSAWVWIVVALAGTAAVAALVGFLLLRTRRQAAASG
jgi:hypothetical protein